MNTSKLYLYIEIIGSPRNLDQLERAQNEIISFFKNSLDGYQSFVIDGFSFKLEPGMISVGVVTQSIATIAMGFQGAGHERTPLIITNRQGCHSFVRIYHTPHDYVSLLLARELSIITRMDVHCIKMDVCIDRNKMPFE